MTFISVYPSYEAFYYSFYIEGLRQCFGSHSIHYSTKGFVPFDKLHMALQIEGKKIVISAHDDPSWNKDYLEWCDVYAKINIDPEDIPDSYRHKIVSIPPSFGIRVYRPFKLVTQYLRSIGGDPSVLAQPKELRERLAEYIRQYRYRKPASAYAPAQAYENFIFFSTSIWKNEREHANLYRRYFMEAARESGAQTDVGYLPRSKKDVTGYEDLTRDSLVSHETYVERTRRSTLVFNTPAVLLCHGWKLGEYLAFGKAIISTPLARVVPAPLEHGVHIHIVEPTKIAMADAINKLLVNKEYRQSLERNSRAYWERYGTPQKVIELILSDTRIDSQLQKR